MLSITKIAEVESRQNRPLYIEVRIEGGEMEIRCEDGALSIGPGRAANVIRVRWEEFDGERGDIVERRAGDA